MIKILLISDSEEFLFSISDALEDEDFDVVKIDCPMMATDFLSLNDVDAIVLDVALGVNDGVQLVKELKVDSLSKSTKMIVLSDNEKDTEESKRWADAVLGNPISCGVLVKTINELLYDG